MEHVLKLEGIINSSIKIIEAKELVFIEIDNNHSVEQVGLSKKELHTFIGALLHVQQKMK